MGLPDARQRLVGLRGAIANTENLIRAVDPSVTGRTSGTFATEAQRSRMVTQEREPLGEQLGTQQQGLSDETLNISDLSNRSLEEAKLREAEQTEKENALNSLYEMLYKREQDKLMLDEARKSRAAASAGLGGLNFNNPAPTPTATDTKKYIGNDDFRGRLAYEAKKGNKDAGIALKYSGNDGRYDGPVNSLADYYALRRVGIRGSFYMAGGLGSPGNIGRSGSTGLSF